MHAMLNRDEGYLDLGLDHVFTAKDHCEGRVLKSLH